MLYRRFINAMVDRHYSPLEIRLLVFLSYAIAFSFSALALGVFIAGGVSLVFLVVTAVVVAYAVAYSALDYWFLTPRLTSAARAARRKVVPPMVITWVIMTPLWIIGFLLADVSVSVWFIMAVVTAVGIGSPPMWLR